MQDHVGRCVEAWQRNVAALSQSLGSAMQAHAAQAQQEMQMVADNLKRLHSQLKGQQKAQPSALFAVRGLCMLGGRGGSPASPRHGPRTWLHHHK